MSAEADNSFLTFLRNGIERGGFETDDALAAVLPLMRQVVSGHALGKVAPLRGVDDLSVGDPGIGFDAAKMCAPRKETSRIEELQRAQSRAVEIVGRSQHVSDIDAGSFSVTNLEVNTGGGAIDKPAFLPNYVCWEHACGQHDELTDIFSVGLILASVACGLDFTDGADLDLFANHRSNLFSVRQRLNPVVAAVIVEMTELNRHRRAQDLNSLIRRLEH